MRGGWVGQVGCAAVCWIFIAKQRKANDVSTIRNISCKTGSCQVELWMVAKCQMPNAGWREDLDECLGRTLLKPALSMNESAVWVTMWPGSSTSDRR